MGPDSYVLLVTDRLPRAERLARGIDVVMPCRIMACEQPLPREWPAALIVDVGSHHDARARWIDALGARIEAGVPCLYLARDGSAREDAIIARLARPVVVSAQSHASGLITLLRKALDAARASDAPAERRVEGATRLVERLFTAAGSGAAPSAAEADAGTEIVMSTISEVGIRTFLDMVWRHDIAVYQHSLSVAGYAAAFAAELRFPDIDRYRLTKAALLHDIGKSRIPLAILNKAEPLTTEETAVMRTHAALGADLLAQAGGFEPEIVDVARWHHERLDGSGYPDALRADAIGDLVRLVAICDVHSALTERRVYRAPLPTAEARTLIQGMAGQLDADLLRAYRPILGCTEHAG